MGRKPRIVRKQRCPNRMEEISEELNSRLESNKTVEKCMKKMKYLIEKYKEAKSGTGNRLGAQEGKAYFTTRSTLSWDVEISLHYETCLKQGPVEVKVHWTYHTAAVLTPQLVRMI